jgi:dihydrofolate reductase
MKVTLVMAITLDGKIGKSPDHFPDWTGKEDKRLFANLSRKAGVVIMGSRTFDTIGMPLAGRKNVIFTRDRHRKSEWENLIFTDQEPKSFLAGLEKEGYNEVILAGGAFLNSLFAEKGLIDELVVTICPKIFGYGISLFSQEVSMELELISVDRLGPNMVCLKYAVLKDNR